MTEIQKTIAAARARISYPEFEDDSMPEHTREMNSFFLALAEAVSAAAEEIGKRRADGIRTLTGDYKMKTDGARITVEYRITVRRRGKTETAKTLVYTWEDGTLISPPCRSPFSLRKRS